MAEPPRDDDALPPEVARSRTISIVWLVPLFAVGVGLWLSWDAYRQRGPVITLQLSNAEGLEANQTRVRLLDVEVGMVTDLAVAPDFSHVVATIKMDKAAEAYMVEGTRFWVVRPRIGPGGISGLSTVLSGPYIAVAPGEGEPTTEFAALTVPPPFAPPEPGRRFVLTTENLGGVARGSGVFHRGLRVGQVVDYRLMPNDRGVEIDVFVPEEAAELVRTDARFWLANGIEFHLDATGLRVEMTSLEAFLAGGIAFRSPLDSLAPTAPDGQEFALFRTPQDAEDAKGAGTVTYMAYFEGNIGGLRTGSPVLFRGVRIGRVLDVRFDFDPVTASIRVPVRFEVFERQLFVDDDAPSVTARRQLDALTAQGLRARLVTLNIVTGDLAIAFDEVADPPPAAIDWAHDPPIFPTVPGSFDELQASLQDVLRTFRGLPLEELAEDFRRIVQGAADLLTSPGLTDGLDEAGAAAAVLRTLLADLQAELPGLLATAERTLGEADAGVRELRRAIAGVTDVVQGVDRLVDGAQTVPYDTQRLLQELRLLTRSLNQFVDYLERNPEALLRGRR
ncbi:MAG: MCE family protein [Geminicoccaceae bacterium]|nr:MAG: MCE family protein [Geminicoccaceae bacterium]